MTFNVNSTFMYILAICVILFVLAQSFFFLIRAYKRGKELGMESSRLKKTIISTSVFTIAPAISILIGVVTLAKFLGIPLPWIRMSVIGAITYELPAATSTDNNGCGNFFSNCMGYDAWDTAKHYSSADSHEKDSGRNGENQNKGQQVGRSVFNVYVSWDDFRFSWHGICRCAKRSCRMDSCFCVAGVCRNYECVRITD